MKIKVRELVKGCRFEVKDNGDWIDLRSAIDAELDAPQAKTLKRKKVDGKEVSYRDVEMTTYYIPLGIAMELPKGYEAIIDSRSSGPHKMGLFIPNGQGVVDNSYSGNNDQWNYICSPMRRTTIHKGDRICQFKVQLSQKATVWQKIKWLFSHKIKFIWVDSLSDKNRGGFGSTGVR